MRALMIGLLSLLTVGAGTAHAADPKLSVAKRKLDRAVVCEGKIGPRRPAPILFSTGTGTAAEDALTLVKEGLLELRRPICRVDYPDFTTADVQLSAEYLVHAIRVVHRRAGKPIAIYGVSQGGLIPRWALTYWPSLRRKVGDVVAVAGTLHGTTAIDLSGRFCGPYKGCIPAGWQQVAGSNLLRALNRPGRDETPGPTAWTTVRSLTDETVTPQDGPTPTSSLAGATNIAIQAVCPGRAVPHLVSYLDGVSIAALRDAITHRGAARVSRLPSNVCAKRYAKGLTAEIVLLLLDVGVVKIEETLAMVPFTLAEPPVKRYAR
jgi:hypothetical protein